MIIFIIWNAVVFFLYGLDKYRAIRGWRRINEWILLLSAFLMGGIGAFLGMQILRHKTRHLRFNICVPLAILVNFAYLYYKIKM